MSEAGRELLSAAIERLKLEGNGFYTKRDFEAARQKYTEAIEKDPENPVLYANRAAAYLGEKQYVSLSTGILQTHCKQGTWMLHGTARR